jgi:hypothetical protein
MSGVTAQPYPAPSQAVNWLTCRYVAIDLEGHASRAGQPEGLVEVAAVEFTAIGTRIHGLSDRDAAGQPTLAPLGPRLSEPIRRTGRRQQSAAAGPSSSAASSSRSRLVATVAGWSGWRTRSPFKGRRSNDSQNLHRGLVAKV